MKGNVIVGQSGGPTAAINSSLAGVYSAAAAKGVKVYGMVNGIEGLLKGKYTDLSTQLKNENDIELLKRTPSSFLGSCRYKLPEYTKDEAPYIKLFETFKELDIKYVTYIGGNDSMDTIMKLSAYAESINSDIRFMGVPKTIDNDLSGTDHTPGFGSAAKYVAATMKEVICDCNVYDMEAVTIVEVMGRNAGWLTASAALAKDGDCVGPDLIYLPEHDFDTEDFLRRVKELAETKKTVVVAVSESLKTKGGGYLCEENLKDAKEDAFGHKIFTGSALYLADLVKDKLGIKSRGIVLNTVQRCAAHISSLCDINEAFGAGETAINLAEEGHTGEMVIFSRKSDAPYEMEYATYDVSKVANEVRTVPDEWIINDGTYVSEEFINYCRPLIMGELMPVIENGLPKHITLKK